ncbi:TRAP transporter permease [Candidatus Hydrogenedentota bacterium]
MSENPASIELEEETEETASAQKLVEDVEFGSRHPVGMARWLIPLLAGGWSLFQLSLPKLVTLNSDLVRSIHLVFAISLVYLSYPAMRRWKVKGFFSFLSRTERIPLVDLTLAVLGALCAAYYALDYVGISSRSGLPIGRDIVVGLLLIALLLEAARRALGPALSIVAGLFIAYSFLGPHMPGIIAFGGVSLNRLVSQLSMSTEGIYGIPLYVSASTVYLFVLFGAMLEKTGGGRYFVRLAFSLLGRYKGGPAKAAVLSSGFTGMVSGSSIANVVTTGTFTIPLMKRCGYPAVKAAAIEVAASTNGQLMPPIMGAAAFIIAEYCGLSYFEVVRAAFIPAVVSYIALIYITHLEASKLGLKGVPKEELPPFRKTLKEGAHFLIPLVFLLTLLLWFRFSPEYSAFWSILVLVASFTGHNIVTGHGTGRKAPDSLLLSLRQVWEGLVAGGKGMMTIGVAVATAGIIVGIVSMGPGQLITEVVDKLAGGNIIAILFLTAIASLILGMGLPTTANYIVMASLTARVITTLAAGAGIEVPLIAAHLFVFYFGILADDTPPVGLAAYAASAIAKSPPIRTGVQGFTYDMRTAILPFMFFFNTDLLLWNVTSWTHGVAIFCASIIAMLAFAAVTQNYFITKNKLHETVLLALVALVLLRPLFFVEVFNMDVAGWLARKWCWSVAGIAVYVAVLLLQRARLWKMSQEKA